MLDLNGLGKLLGYGIGGLGLALAALAYMLLSAEQKIAKPRRQMISAIYVFMAFSLVLTGVGLFFELKRISNETERASSGSLVPMSDNPPDQLWYDVLKATRHRLVGNALSKEYTRGLLNTGQYADIPITLFAGECRSYIVMTKPPARIDISVTSPGDITFTPIAREDHLAFGRFCAAKAPVPALVTLKVTMASGSAPFVAETYEALP